MNFMKFNLRPFSDNVLVPVSLPKKIKCPDPRAKVLDQTSHGGDGFRRQIPTPCPHSPPPPPTGFTLIGALHTACR